MSLPDSAEYWWDVKGYNSKPKHVFYHIKGVECGHYHVFETDEVLTIDCRACKKILSERPDLKKELEDAMEKRLSPYGKCSCGGTFRIRKNHSTKELFAGCSNYPKCRKSKSLS